MTCAGRIKTIRMLKIEQTCDQIMQITEQFRREQSFSSGSHLRWQMLSAAGAISNGILVQVECSLFTEQLVIVFAAVESSLLTQQQEK